MSTTEVSEADLAWLATLPPEDEDGEPVSPPAGGGHDDVSEALAALAAAGCPADGSGAPVGGAARGGGGAPAAPVAPDTLVARLTGEVRAALDDDETVPWSKAWRARIRRDAAELWGR